MSEAPVRYAVEFEFPDADAAAHAIDVLREQIAITAEGAGAAVVRNEFSIDEGSVDDPDGALLAQFEAHVDPEFHLFDPAFQQRLDTPLGSILLHDDLDIKVMRQRKRVLKLLAEHESVVTVRDALVAGITNLSPKGVSSQTADNIASAINSFVPELPLLYSTSPIIAARFCERLDQIVVRGGLSIEDMLASDAHGAWARRYADEFNKAKAAQRLRRL